MTPRRILIFSLNYYPHQVGGAEVAVKEITDRLPASDLEFDMVVLGSGEALREERIGNVRVHRIFRKVGALQKLLYPFAAARLGKKLQKQHHYQMVWAIMASYAGYAAYLFKKANPNVPIILTIQEGDHFGRREGVFGPLFRKIFKAADRIQVISNYLADWSQHMGAMCPISVVPNGVDFEHFSAPVTAERRATIRREAGFKDDDIVLVTASRLVFKNAIDDIISALVELDPRYKLLVLGTGPLEHRLKELAARLGVAGRTVFGGFVPHAELPAYLQSSEIFVRPSRSEGLGNSFLEAMAAGIPVIATPAGGIADFLKDGETGLYCEIGNPRSIAQKVEKLAKDRESRDYIVKTAREMVMKKYGWAGIAANMKTIFDAALKSA